MTYPPLIPSDRPTIDRAIEVLSAWRRVNRVKPLAPFQPNARWRLSPDVDLRVRGEAELYSEYMVAEQRSEDRLFGWPIDVDDSLPPNSMLLEEALG